MKKTILFFSMLLCAIVSMAQTIYYVREGGSGTKTGDSWINASNDLQAMIDAAAADATPGQVFVAVGTYKPTQIIATNTTHNNDVNTVTGSTTNRDKAFVLKKGVKIYGGFDPTDDGATLASNRTLPAATGGGTILSGNLEGNTDRTTYAYHVVVSPNTVGYTGTALLDGFTIRDGNATGSYNVRPPDTFSDFNQSFGGGMSIYGSSPTLNNITFIDNYASNHGGGIYMNGSTSTLTNVTIAGNAANGSGGGILNWGGSPKLTKVLIIENTANGNSDITTPSANFRGGGGMMNLGSGSPILTDVTISYNYTPVKGGGMLNVSGSTPKLINVIITENEADNGGGIYNQYATPHLTNVLLTKNVATGSGGGVFNNSSSPNLTNVTISDNTAGTQGGGMYNSDAYDETAHSSPIINNSVIWGNTANTVASNISNDGDSNNSPAVQYSIVQGMDNTANGGMDGTIAANAPQFTDASSNNYSLQTTSTGVNDGNDALYTGDLDADKDLIGNARQVSTIDMGAYESSTVLSADFGAFSAIIQNNRLVVNWATLKEANNAFFTVEVSKNGVDFVALDKVKSKALNGNSSTTINYNYQADTTAWASLLAFPLLLIGFGAGFLKRHKIAAVTVSAVLIIAFAAGCQKRDTFEAPAADAKIYVRIAQTDIDGTVKYSKVIMATNP